jgi:hypothetical protein
MSVSEEPPTKKRHTEQVNVDDLISTTEFTECSIRALTVYFNSLEKDDVRKAILPLVKYDSWVNLGSKLRESIFESQPKLENLMNKGLKTYDPSVQTIRYFQVNFVANLIEFTITNVVNDGSMASQCCQLLIDLLSQLPTRRSVRLFLVDRLFRERAQTQNSGLQPLIDRINYYVDFPINDFTAEMMTQIESEERLEFLRDQVKTLCWKSGKMEEIGLSSSKVLFGTAAKCEELYNSISPDLMKKILEEVLLVDLNRGYSEDVLRQVFINRLTGKEIFEIHNSVGVKLGLQYLSFQDYLERNLRLYEVESSDMIQTFVNESLTEMVPIPVDGGTKFGFRETSRMGLGIEKFEIKKIIKKTLISSISIIAQLTVDLRRTAQPIRDEWDNEVRVDDAMILVTLPNQSGTVSSVVQVADIQGNIVGPGQVARDVLVGDKRVLTVSITGTKGEELPMFHAVVRVKDSHFKYKLGNLKRLLNDAKRSSIELPEFISDMVLGYGDPQTASSSSATEQIGNVRISQGDSLDPVDVSFPIEGPVEHRAIACGLCPGLTIISGSDRSDVVARLIESAVMKKERILLISKYNETLQKNLSKLSPKFVDKEYILRPAGSVDDTFGQYRVINHILKLRLKLLSDVGSLAVSMGLKDSADDFSYSCDNAHQMYLNVVETACNRYKKVLSDIEGGHISAEEVIAHRLQNNGFPPGIRNIPGYDEGQRDKKLAARILIENNSVESILYPFRREEDGSEISIESIRELFNKLGEFKPFEILKTVKDRSQYLLACQARVVAITNTGLCKHLEAFVDSKAQFSTIIVDDANEIPDVEIFFALVAQKYPNKKLGKLILAGDGRSSFSGSMFERFVRLGVPVYEL